MKGRVAKCLYSEHPSADIQNTMFIIQFFTLAHMMRSAILSGKINSTLIKSCWQPSFSESIYIDRPGVYANHLLNNNRVAAFDVTGRKTSATLRFIPFHS